MRYLLILGLILGGWAPLSSARADESCGPKSGLCWPKVERGAKGPRVIALQYLLRNRGYKVAADGKFAFATESAVRRFQAKNRLKVDGKLGWQSWEAITPDLKRGAKGNAVRALQTLLNFTHPKVAQDGFFGPETQKIVAKIQWNGAGSDPDQGEGEARVQIWCFAAGGCYSGE